MTVESVKVIVLVQLRSDFIFLIMMYSHHEALDSCKDPVNLRLAAMRDAN